MFNIREKKNQTKIEYEMVNANPIVRGLIHAAVVVIDLFIMVLLIWNVYMFFIPPGSWLNVVSGNSMDPTMHDGQILFSDPSRIHRGDIVSSYMPDIVFETYPEQEGMIVVKRVVGVPGDRLIINQTGVYVNDELIDEVYLSDEAKAFTYVEKGCNSVLLDEGEYFLMGDNREVSYDSRYFGVVTDDLILYKQSESATRNFWLKLALLVSVLIMDIFIYKLIEYVLTACAFALIFKKKKNEVLKGEKDDGVIC